MKRRTFLRGMTVALVATPLVSEAQQTGKVWRIGVLAGTRWGPFRERLRALGYVEGQNIAIEWRSSGGRSERRADQVIDISERAPPGHAEADSLLFLVAEEPPASGFAPHHL